jgi:predicted phosphoribosyltransferase
LDAFLVALSQEAPGDPMLFHKREYAAHRLASKFHNRPLQQPLILAIPRGGIVLGVVLARELDAEVDVVLTRTLRAPGYPTGALGAVAEDGRVYLNDKVRAGPDDGYLARERSRQLTALASARKLYRDVRPQAICAGRSVIVTDDGIHTGSAMIAALQVLKGQGARELIAAVPVAPPEQLDEVRRLCDQVICLHSPDQFWRIADFYADFTRVEDNQAVSLMRAAVCKAAASRQPARFDILHEMPSPYGEPIRLRA